MKMAGKREHRQCRRHWRKVIPDQLGDWRLLDKIDCGGNGCVYRASADHGLEEAAVKVPHKHIWRSEILYDRFRREVEAYRACEGLDGVLRLFDANLPARPDNNDRPYLVLELAVSLDRSLGRGRTRTRRCVEAVYQIASTLVRMHRSGYFHRDIKPDNLFSVEGRAKIGDLGLVRTPDGDTLTRPKERLGAFYFMAPEMFGDTDGTDFAKADVYSLAKTLWCLVPENKNPLPGHMVIDIEAFRLSSWDKSLLPLDILLMNSTDPKPDKGPAMEEFASELNAWLQPVMAGPSAELLDLSDLAPAIQPTNRLHILNEQRDKEARKRNSEIWYGVVNRFRDWGLGPLTRAFEGAGLIRPGDSASGPSFALATTLKSEIYNQLIVLIFGVDVQPSEKEYDGGEIVVNIRYEIQIPGLQSGSITRIWGATTRFVPGGSKAENEIIRLISSAEIKARPAVKLFQQIGLDGWQENKYLD